jgi:hypothetical protein
LSAGSHINLDCDRSILIRRRGADTVPVLTAPSGLCLVRLISGVFNCGMSIDTERFGD